jgi:PAS domain S-box-containing protein
MTNSYEGNLAGLGVGSEVTEREWAEEAHRQRDFYKALLEAQSDVGEGLIVIEGERIRYANNAFCLMSGYSAEELISLPTFWGLAAPDQRTVLYGRMRRRLRGEWVEDRYETAMLHRSGERVKVEVGVRPHLREGQLSHLVVVVHDITARKQVEERLQSSLDMLVAVHETARVLSSSLDSSEISKRLLEVVHHLSNLDAAILRSRDQRGHLSVVDARGPQGLLQLASAAAEAQDARLRVLETGEYQRPFRMARPKEGDMPLVGLCLPLVVRERVIGLLEAYGREALATQMAVETLQSLAGQAASALENAWLYEELAERERRFKDLVGKLIGVKEEERRRLAYEVHDGLTQVAVAAHQHLQAFAKDYLPDSAPSQTKLEDTLELARQTVREARSVIADLQPTALKNFGLATALRSKVETLRADGWEIDYDEALGDECLSDEIEMALYRVAQEALANIRKHAQTTRARITLARCPKSAYLEVRDWGLGFEQGATAQVSGWGEQVGIYGMRERITWLGGVFTIRSRPGAGTRIVAEVPLPTSEGLNGDRAR